MYRTVSLHPLDLYVGVGRGHIYQVGLQVKHLPNLMNKW